MPLRRRYSDSEVWCILHQSEGNCLQAKATWPAHAMKWHSHGTGEHLLKRFLQNVRADTPRPREGRKPTKARENSAYLDMGIQVRATTFILNTNEGQQSLALLDQGKEALPVRVRLPRGRFPAATLVQHADGIHYRFVLYTSAI